MLQQAAQELGGLLYDSLHGKLLLLPDGTLVYPAHGAGSLCGKNLSSDTVSTLGDQRRLNYALRPMTKDEFIRLVTASQPDAPDYFTYDAILNTREHPKTLDRTLERVLHPVELQEVLDLGDAGEQILDVRDPSEYAKGHLAGSINAALGGQYATWAGTVLDRSRPIVIIAEPGREQEAALRLGRIGFDHVKGYLKDGMAALAERQDLVWPTKRVTASILAEELASPEPPYVGRRVNGIRNTSSAASTSHSTICRNGWPKSRAPEESRSIARAATGPPSRRASSGNTVSLT